MKISENAELSQSLVLSLLESNTDREWKLFVNYDKNGVEIPQYKEYDPPKKLSYPDFEGRKNNTLVCLVEVKYHNGDFDGIPDTIAIKEKNLRHYHIVRKKERVPLHIVFVIFNSDGTESYFWQKFPDIWNIKHDRYMYEWRYKNGNSEIVETWFFNKNDFRTDYWNLGR